MIRADLLNAQAEDVIARANDLEVLLGAMRRAIDHEAPMYALNAVDTLITCAERNVSLIHENQVHTIEMLAIPTAVGDSADIDGGKVEGEAGKAGVRAYSFDDVYGAKVTVLADELGNYIGLKAEQLRALSDLLVNVTSGGEEIGDVLRNMLILMAKDCAHTVDQLSNFTATELLVLRKGVQP